MLLFIQTVIVRSTQCFSNRSPLPLQPINPQNYWQVPGMQVFTYFYSFDHQTKIWPIMIHGSYQLWNEHHGKLGSIAVSYKGRAGFKSWFGDWLSRHILSYCLPSPLKQMQDWYPYYIIYSQVHISHKPPFADHLCNLKLYILTYLQHFYLLGFTELVTYWDYVILDGRIRK